MRKMSKEVKIKIPHSAFKTFKDIARKDNGNTHEILCYFLGEEGKVDTILLPKQERNPSSVIDKGMNFKGIFDMYDLATFICYDEHTILLQEIRVAKIF